MVHWKINQTAITEKFCENKAKPVLKCNGKCHLMKQLKLREELDAADVSKSSKKTQPKLNKFKNIECFEENSPSFILEHAFVEVRITPLSPFFSHYQFEKLNDCFHPPQIS